MGKDCPRLLFVVNDAAFYVSHRRPLGLAARALGWDVHVAAPVGPGAAAIRGDGIPFHPLRLRRKGLNPVAAAAGVVELVRLYRRLRPDVVHHVTIKPILLGGVAARLARVPAVVHAVSGLGYVFLRQGAVGAVLRLVARSAYRMALAHPRQRVIFQNPVDREEFVRRRLVRLEDAVLIRGSGVDLATFRPQPEPAEPPLVVLPARLLWDKGVGEFVEAARRLGDRARFVLCGGLDPVNPRSLDEATVRSWERDGVVTWWGHQKHMAEVFARCHVVCLPSYREGLPKSLQEAAACGRPVVTTNVPGCRDAVVEGVTGLLAPARDARALASAIGTLIGDPEVRRRMGAAGRQLAMECFSDARVARETMEVYGELTAAAGIRAPGAPRSFSRWWKGSRPARPVAMHAAVPTATEGDQETV